MLDMGVYCNYPTYYEGHSRGAKGNGKAVRFRTKDRLAALQRITNKCDGRLVQVRASQPKMRN